MCAYIHIVEEAIEVWVGLNIVKVFNSFYLNFVFSNSVFYGRFILVFLPISYGN